jgi:iron complex outermembrane receptor protein
MKKFLLLMLFVTATKLFAQDVNINGVVNNAATLEPITGATVKLKNAARTTTTNVDGSFTLNISKLKLPVTLIISSVNTETFEIKINNTKQAVQIALMPTTIALNEVVTAASRVQESILASPVSIEKMSVKTIKENPSFTFYDGLQSLKGMEVVTSSLTYKQVNTRGFNSTGNSRFLQLVDGVDNQTPGLNFAIGNLFGASDMDIESAEVVPGSASALYGPVAFNGALLMKTKDPFKYQGLSLQLKTGLNHVNENSLKPQGLNDVALRYAKAFNNKLAFKINASYLNGLDWYANDFTDISAGTPPSQRGDNNPGRDALNIYGDEVSKTMPGIGLVTRTGYQEKDLMNYNVYSLKLNGALHYKFNKNLEAIYQYNYGKGTANYTGSSRFALNNFVLQTNRLELKGDHFFVRGYSVVENSHNSYNTRSLAQFINRDWVLDAGGNKVAPAIADDTWFNNYKAAFDGTIAGISGNNQNDARTYADRGRYLPGSPDFDNSKNNSINTFGIKGAGVFSNSKLYHTDAQYDFTKHIKFVELLAGGSFRRYDMFTNGSLFDDINQKITINEYGGFLQAGKRLLKDKLKLSASLRYDKNQNFEGNYTPRFSAVYAVAKTHYFRTSYQTGFRNPTPVDQFINLNVGPITILGGAPKNSQNLNVYQNSYTAASVSAFGQAFGAAVAGGTPFPQAVAANKGLLQQANVAYIKPEQQKAFEVGYKGLFENKFMVDVNYYYSSYTNFILNTVVINLSLIHI